MPAKWDWDVHRTRIVRLLATALQVDLRQLYSMSQPEENLIAFFAKLVLPATFTPCSCCHLQVDLSALVWNIIAEVLLQESRLANNLK